MKRILLIVALLTSLSLSAQSSWTQFDKLMNDGSYKSAYALAEGVYHKSAASGDRLAAAYHMAQAASLYQEDARDSSVARYRALLPSLEPLEKALCHAFLGEYDSALAYSDVLKATPVEKIRMYCDAEKSVGLTPTAFDVVVRRILNDYSNQKTTIQRRVELQRMLVEFHAGDGDDIRIWNENRLLDYLSNVPNRPMPLERIGESIAKFRGTKSPWYTLLYQRAARWCNDKEDFVAALRYCDTAIQLAPKSEGGIGCANLKNEILQKRVMVEDDGLVIPPNTVSLQRVRYRNLDQLSWRIIPYVEDFNWNDKAKAKMLAAKAVESGEWKVERGKDYNYAESYVSLPALKTGKYLLLVWPSKDRVPAGSDMADGFMAYEVNVTDMYLIQNGQEGLLLDRRKGKPIAGQELLLKKVDYRNTTLLERAHTDSNGRYRFTTKEYHYNYKIIIERDGYTIDASYGYAHEAANPTMHPYATMCTDRPIYKPGDTVQVAAVAYRCNGLDAQVWENEQVELLFFDPNGKVVEKKTLTTDDFGVVHAAFVIPTDRIAGLYQLEVRSISKNGRLQYEFVRVEEYKQPKFMVSLSAEVGSRSAEFGKPYTIQGLAASYSAVPVSGARVQYTVTRREMYRRWWLWRSWESPSVTTEVASGELTTAADGSFNIVFTPEPDSSVELSTKPCFVYTVNAIVTDLNGESHEETFDLRVGFQNAFLSLEAGSTMDNLKVKHFDLNGNELPGKVDVKIERLRQPQTPLLDSPLLTDDAHHTMSEADFRKAFPLLAYDKNYNSPDRWPVAEAGWKGQSGVYRITLSAEGADTVVEYITHTAQDASKVQSQQLLWAEVDKKRVEVGETVRLRFGSRFKDVDVYYLLRIGDEERDFRRITVSDELRSITIPVDSAMLGGFQIDLIAVREGIRETASYSVSVPFSHKELKVEISTFRDKLLPGETEEWTISVKSYELGVKSALMMTMYDDALNSYGNTLWGFSPWRTNSSNSFSYRHIYGSTGHYLNEYKHLYYNGSYPSVWSLKEALPYYNRWGGRRMYKSARAANNVVNEEEEEVVTELSVVEDAVPVIEVGTAESGQRLSSDDIERMPGTSVKSIVAAVGGIGYSDGSSATQAVQVRTNLNTLAFFAPNLRTGDDGTVTYRFTVPELLTRWNVRGLAVTRDLKSGTLSKTLVTSKPLMVQPNMPRFLCSGDSLSLMAKIVRSEELGVRSEELPVEVMFVLTDAATGDTICHHTESVLVKDAAQVMFDVEVPQHVYVATYKIVVSCQLPEGSYSDGEQGQVPVVTNRQAVTLSQAMYINGAGEKLYSLPEWLVGSDSREPRLVGAEVVSDPVWLAIKSMPYLKVCETPSVLYLANQLYVNSLGQEILKDLGDLRGLKDFKEPVSRLKMNEEVKQTLLKATPWVRDAESEEEQMAAVKHYFDSAALNSELRTLTSELSQRQNSDGGWSWMPEGKSSLWVTQQVLKKVKGEKLKVKEALEYVDREQQRYYEKWIKPYLKKGYQWNPTDIDYLYTRSFYGKGSTEAYKYYYDNALKHYKDFGNLYTQAQLALIFHRHGAASLGGKDRKAALDLLRRIKEKALVSDEMGMYWRDNQSGWCWYQRPVETQALLIQAFAEITPDDRETIGLMQQWLLKQKQTTHWGNDAATAEAIGALMVNEKLRMKNEEMNGSVQLTVFGEPMSAEAQGLEGYRSQRWTGASLDSLRGLGSSDIVIRKADDGIAWGAVYYQFADDMDKIPSSEMGIKIVRSYELGGKNLKVGDKLKVRIDIQCDRTMEYLELIDGRPSCVEPLDTRAGWRWNEGLSYYIVVNTTDTRCYIDRLEKGKYYFEYEVYVTNPGHFLAGPVTMQCMYAPEFRAVAPAQPFEVDNQ